MSSQDRSNTGTGRLAYGLGIGVCAGISLAVVEISGLAWRSRVPLDIASAIVCLDLVVMAAIGALATLAARNRDPGPYILAGAMSLVMFPMVAGRVMDPLWERFGAWSSGMLWTATVAIAGGAALVGGCLLAATMAWLVRLACGPTRRWEAWAVIHLVTIGVLLSTTFANYSVFPGFRSLPGLACNAAMGLLLIGLGYGAVRLTRALPVGATFAGALVLVVGLRVLLPTPGASSLRAAGSSTDGPNVILIVLDTVRADHMSLYGYPRATTPNLDAFAGGALVFDHAVSNSSWTLPAHASLFTGVDPRSHGAHGRQPGDDSPGPPFGSMTRALPTLAEAFSAGGYRTAAFVSNYGSLAPDFGFDRGFEIYDATPRSVVIARPALGALLSLLMPVSYAAFIRPYRDAGQINEAALAWTDLHGNEPFFLFLNYMEAHHPYEPPPEFYGRFEGGAGRHDDQRVPWTWYERLRRDLHRGQAVVSGAEADHLNAAYDASIAYLDHEMAQLLEGLGQRGLLEDSLIVITSDHGELFGEHDLLGHGFSPYEGVVHVPLLVRFPGTSAGGRVAESISTREVFRIALGTGLSPTPVGELLQAALAQPVVSEVYVHPLRAGYRPPFLALHRALYDGKYKLIDSSDGHRELYDLVDDPGEETDLAPTSADRTTAMRLRLKDWLASTTVPDPDAAGTDVDEETLKRLKALGYLP